MRIRLGITIFFFAFCLNILTGQEKNNRITLEGTVLDVDKQPIPNAIVLIDGQKTHTITDSRGNYKVKIKPTNTRIGIFTFSCGLFEEEINGRSRIDFNFSSVSHNRFTGISLNDRPEIPDGEKAVDIGYGHIKKKYLTTDITFIDGTDKKFASYSSIFDMIQREVSGVWVDPNTKTIIIQGSRNMSGFVKPLFVVDGTYTSDISYIAPSSVKSISVLKGTAAAIYGSRGFGGVIIIRTKSYDE
jgi:TonB-dependent SusC/RagA subfamily outer membrane receptor